VTGRSRDHPLDARKAAFVPSADFAPALALDVERVKKRLEAGNGGYEIVHTSPGLEVGVYVLVAPEPDRQQPHEDDELYYVLDGCGMLDIEGQPVPLEQGQAIFVPAGARHQFTGYEHLSVLVVFARQWRLAPPPHRSAP
jgi:mannose-6-phosphate isomerase-like protein (cupin superfamily)